MQEVVVPAETWERVASACSAHLVVEQKGAKPVSVRTVEYDGFVYTALSVFRTSFGGRVPPCVRAYRLLPLALYSGDTTTVYHDDAAISEGRRKRGDHTGLIVAVHGRQMVCAEEVRFLMALPGTKPLSFAEALAYDEKWRTSGWRRLCYGGVDPEWASLGGHPVAVYRWRGDTGAVLLWRYDGAIQELRIDESVPLDAVTERVTPPASPRRYPPAEAGYVQMSLF